MPCSNRLVMQAVSTHADPFGVTTSEVRARTRRLPSKPTRSKAHPKALRRTPGVAHHARVIAPPLSLNIRHNEDPQPIHPRPQRTLCRDRQCRNAACPRRARRATCPVHGATDLNGLQSASLQRSIHMPNMLSRSRSSPCHHHPFRCLSVLVLSSSSTVTLIVVATSAVHGSTSATFTRHFQRLGATRRCHENEGTRGPLSRHPAADTSSCWEARPGSLRRLIADAKPDRFGAA